MLSPILFLAALAAASDPAASQAVNNGYEALSQARLAHDVEGMTANFASEGLLVDSRPNPPISGSEMAGQLAPMVARLKADGASVRTQYRIERRSIIGDTVVDAGFMKMAFERPATGDGKPGPRDMIRRFMVTWKKGTDGRWRIIGDASFPATVEQWDATKPKDGLFYE